MMSKKVILEWIADNKAMLADLEASGAEEDYDGYDEIRLEIRVLETVLK